MKVNKHATQILDKTNHVCNEWHENSSAGDEFHGYQSKQPLYYRGHEL